ncbi:MAG: deoxyguanosinetriphosphate triphosphohydrolase [Chloroflexi bacterium]|nr:deoxyguanosinetriphosphate triphosphohydrolase [Chloroflexota bacterium]
MAYLYTREVLEAWELEHLAPYAHKSRFSRGRFHPEPEPKYRTAFQRDRDRIIHTTAFRRLEYKTQVFITYEGDYYRTRLTHTLEVAQIARSIARALGANEVLTEAIALVHDLGHPPFGHAGEAALDALMAEHGGFFNHNMQAFRIVTELERRYPHFKGLNLTWETLEGLVKHETSRPIPAVQAFNPELRGHFEAQIANIADDLAYITHDLDDGLRSGMLTPALLRGQPLWERMRERIGWKPNGPLDELTRHRIIRHLVGLLVDDVIETTAQRLEKSGVQTVEELQRLPYNVVSHSPEVQEQRDALKAFLYENMYYHPRVLRMAYKAERIIRDLFQAYTQRPETLPKHIQARVEEYGLYQAVCDYIAGMTDRFAIEEHRKLFDPAVKP